MNNQIQWHFRGIFCTALSAWLILAGSHMVFAQTPDTGTGCRSFSLYIENDVCFGSDDQYTGGLKLTWSRYGLSWLPPDAWAHRWLYPVMIRLGFKDMGDEDAALTFSLGQNIYTPKDIKAAELIRDDRPYAGITYAEVGFHRKTSARMHTFALCAGIVGPHSYAEDIQTFGHDLLNSDATNGWDHQLEDEPVICMIYDYKRKFIQTGIGSGFGGEAVFHTGGSVGNIRTFYSAGMLLRYGWKVPNDFGNFPIQPATCFNGDLKGRRCKTPKNRFGIHLFVSGSSQLVLHDIFLDGNTFRDSHSVDKKPVVGLLTGGIGLVYGSVKTALACVFRTKSFETQEDPEIFGSLNVSFHY